MILYELEKKHIFSFIYSFTYCFIQQRFIEDFPCDKTPLDIVLLFKETTG